MGDFIVGAILLVAFIAAIRYVYKNKKKGGCAGCSGSCASCGVNRGSENLKKEIEEELKKERESKKERELDLNKEEEKKDE